MSDTLVSVRLPKGLIKELKLLAPKRHYLDLSEQVRSVVRQKAIQYLTAIGNTRVDQARTQEQLKKKEEIVDALRRLLLEVER